MISFSQLGNLGRLGNQLFQIAVTVVTAKKNNENYIFPAWQYESDFNLHNCFSSHIPITKTYQEPHFHYAPLPAVKDTDLNGYFQSYKYWEGYEDIVKSIFEFKTPVRPLPGVTSIHIRRGDYINISQYHNNLSITNYYEKAMSIMASDHYFIFSDDINFCKTKFKGSQFSFIENGTAISDLELMSACENNIVANSSFSYWGAYLNKNINKKIIAPKQWFGPAIQHNTNDLLPLDWIKI